MARIFLIIAAISGLCAVALGAFGAHGLKGILSAELMSAFQTAVQYHFYHTLALCGVSILLIQYPNRTAFVAAAWAFVVGLVLFCGSLYGLAFGAPRWMGPITPLGGASFMAGWMLLVVGAWRLNKSV